MTALISRRWFMLGTAAAIAVAKLPPTLEFVQPLELPPSDEVVSRMLYDVVVHSEGEMGELNIARELGGPSILNINSGRGMTYRWVAPPLGELVLKNGNLDVLSMIDWWPPPEDGFVNFIFRDKYDDGGCNNLCQTFAFRRFETATAPPAPMNLNRLYPPGHPKHVPLVPSKSSWEDDDYEDDEGEV